MDNNVLVILLLIRVLLNWTSYNVCLLCNLSESLCLLSGSSSNTVSLPETIAISSWRCCPRRTVKSLVTCPLSLSMSRPVLRRSWTCGGSPSSTPALGRRSALPLRALHRQLLLGREIFVMGRMNVHLV